MKVKTVIAIMLLVLAVGCSREMKKEYYPDGKLKAVLNYKKGKLDGVLPYTTTRTAISRKGPTIERARGSASAQPTMKTVISKRKFTTRMVSGKV